MAYKRGDIIMRNRPWTYVLEEKHAASYCHFCFRRIDFSVERADLLKGRMHHYDDCLFAHYCDPKCAKSGWKDHKVECKRLDIGRKKNLDIPECNIRLLARIMSKLLRGEKTDPPEACTPRTDRNYDSLCTHADKIDSSVLQITAFTHIMDRLVAFLGMENLLPDKDAIKDAYSKLIVNAMTLYDGSRPYGIGAALPLGATRFDHACKPNADYMIVSNNGPEIVITALENIPSIGDVRICYTNCMDMTPQRQAIIQEHYYFLCQCEYCWDEHRDNMMRSIRCVDKECDGAIPLSLKFVPKPCTKCKVELAETDSYVRDSMLRMSEINEIVKEYTDLFEGQENTPALLRQQTAAYKKVLTLYEKIKDVLYPLNIFYVKLIVHLADTESYLGWKLYLEETDAYRYYHGFSSFLGIRLVLQAGNQVGAGKLDEAKESLDEAERILSVTHGKDHPVYKDMLNVRRVTIPRLKKMQKLKNSYTK